MGDGRTGQIVAAIQDVARRAVEFAAASRRVDSAEQLEVVEAQAAEVADQLFRVLMAEVRERAVKQGRPNNEMHPTAGHPDVLPPGRR